MVDTGNTIVVNAGEIARITPQFIGTSGSALAIDATGKFVVPGFLDMHAHAMEPTSQPSANWALLLANGVTGVREMSGSDALVANVRQRNADSAAGKVDAPEILRAHGGQRADGIRQAALTGGFAPPFPATYTVNPRLQGIATNAPVCRGILDTFNDAKCHTLAHAFVTNQTWQIPTLVRLRTQNFSTSQEYRADPNLQYVDRARRVQSPPLS